MTVVSVIHQPRMSVFNVFDHMLMLTEGQCAYNGPSHDALDYFAKVNAKFACPLRTNPADHFMDLVTRGSEVGHPDEIVRYYHDHIEPSVEKEVDKVRLGVAVKDTITYRPKSLHTATFWRQLIQLMFRELKLNYRDPQKVSAKAGNSIVMGLLIGMMYYNIKDQYVPAFGYISLAITSMSAMVSLPAFFADRLMFNTERSDRLYTTLPYYLVNTGIGLLVSVLANAVFATVVWSMAGLSWDNYGAYMAICLVIFWATDGLITVIAGTCRTMEQAMALFNMTIGIFLLFNGYSANTMTTPKWLSWICFCSPLYYSIEMFLDQLYGNTPQWQLTGEPLGMKENSFWKDFYICLGIGAGGRILGFIAMKYMHKIQR